MNQRCGPRKTLPISPAHEHTSVHEAAAGGVAPPTTASEPKPAACLPRRPCLAHPAIPAQRTASAQTGDASGDLERLRSASPNTAQGGESPGDFALLCSDHPESVPPPHNAWFQVSRHPWSSKDHARGGAVLSGHDTRHHPAGEAGAHSVPQGGVDSPPQESCPFSRKASSPTFPPIHSPASRRSSSRATRKHPGLRTPPSATELAPLGSRRPQAACARGGAVPPPEAPNSLYSRLTGTSSRNFACTAYAAPTCAPALNPD